MTNPKLVAHEVALGQADALNALFRPAYKSQFTGRVRVASDGGAWMGEFSQVRSPKRKRTLHWVRLQCLPRQSKD